MADARNLLGRLVDTGFVRHAARGGQSPGAPLEGPRGGGASSTRGADLMEWFGSALQGPAGDAEPVVESELDDDRALTLVRAMIAAARADGRIDPGERDRIVQRLEQSGASAGERTLIERELAETRRFEPSADDRSKPRRAAQIYAASAMAIDAARPGDSRYLRDLAERLALPGETVAAIHRRLGTSAPG